MKVIEECDECPENYVIYEMDKKFCVHSKCIDQISSFFGIPCEKDSHCLYCLI